MSQYRIGTVSTTNGSATITGDITTFTTDVTAGDLFTIVGSNVSYEIASVVDDTHLTLTVNYPGLSLTGQAYTIARDFTPNFAIPYVQRGDIETATIIKAAMYRLDGIIDFDTNIVSATDGQALVYSGTDLLWENKFVTKLGTVTVGVWEGSTIAIGYGGTGVTGTPTNGQLLIGNGSGYTLATITAGTGVSVTNGSGTITLANTGVTSNVAGTGISVSSAAGAVTIANTGVLSIAGTSHQIIASTSTGAITLSLPQSIDTTSSPTFASITVSNAPSAATDATNKLYVDSVAQGLDVKQSVIAAATGNVTVSNPGTAVFDGITLTGGQRLLLMNQSTGSQNGIYIFNGSSSALTRSTDFSGSVDGNSVTTWSGSFIFIEQGSTYGSTSWVLTTDDPITIGTTALVFTQFGGPGTYTTGTGLTLSGTTFSISSSYVGQTSITTLGTITSGTWHGTAINLSTYASGTLPGTYGGTGVNNGSSTITLGGSLTTSGAYTTTLTATANTSVTLPTSGTLVNSAVATLSSLASIGTIATGVWQGTAVGATYGGTGISSYTKGDLVYASATNTLSNLAIGTSNQVLTVISGVPTWNTVAGLATFTNPTQTVGLTAVNGSATTVLRGDAAPALDQSISPTWTGTHTFNNTITGAITNLAGGAAGSIPYQTGAGATGFIAAGTNTYVLTMVSGAPAWAVAASAGVSSITGTANEIAASASTGAITLSLPQNVIIPTPASGVGLTVGGVNTCTTLIVNSGNSAAQSVADILVNRAGSTANTIGAGPNIDLYDTTNNTCSILQNSGGQTELWQNNGGWNQIFKVTTAKELVLNYDFQPVRVLPTVQTATLSSSTKTVDLSTGTTFVFTLDTNVTFTFTNPPASGSEQTFNIHLVQDATGSRTVTWPTAVHWNNGVTPVLTTTATKRDIFTFITVDGGTTYYAGQVMANLT